MTEEKIKKRINWYSWKVKCPFCDSTNIEKINLYKHSYISSGVKEPKLKLKEFRMMKCRSCNKSFWK